MKSTDLHEDYVNIIKTLKGSGDLGKRARADLIERISALLEDDARAVTSQYVRLANHILKWKALPSLRSTSWLTTIDDARDTIRGWVSEGGVRAKYAKGLGSLGGHTLSPHVIYHRALNDAVSAYVARHPDKSDNDAIKLFTTAFPSAPSLDFWLTCPTPEAELPDWQDVRKRRNR